MSIQATEDAKKLVEEERAFARAEIENARAAVQRVEEALQVQERIAKNSGNQVVMFFSFSYYDISIFFNRMHMR